MGDFLRERLCPCCKIYSGDYVQVVKFIGGGGGIMSTLQNSRGDYVHLYKNEQGDFVRGILSVCLFVCLFALRPKSTAMVIAGRSVH